MKSAIAYSALLVAILGLQSAADDHSGHAHGNPGHPHQPAAPGPKAPPAAHLAPPAPSVPVHNVAPPAPPIAQTPPVYRRYYEYRGESPRVRAPNPVRRDAPRVYVQNPPSYSRTAPPRESPKVEVPRREPEKRWSAPEQPRPPRVVRREPPVMTHPVREPEKRWSEPSPIKREEHAITLPVREPDRGRFHPIRDDRRAAPPDRDDRGRRLAKEPLPGVPDHRAIADNRRLQRNIDRSRDEERERNRYYWHDVAGTRYCHYDDNWGNHWYGFYKDSSFYWTRYDGARWWWREPSAARWVYWDNGNWWWQDPASTQTAFVFLDNQYYPYDAASGGVTLVAPVETAKLDDLPTAAPIEPASPDPGDSYYNRDKSRLVVVSGTTRDASLYDNSDPKLPIFLSYLGQGVAEVRFSGAQSPQAEQILLTLTDGSFALYDSNGKRYGSSASPEDYASGPPETGAASR